jgi:hypothetical protein
MSATPDRVGHQGWIEYWMQFKEDWLGATGKGHLGLMIDWYQVDRDYCMA